MNRLVLTVSLLALVAGVCQANVINLVDDLGPNNKVDNDDIEVNLNQEARNDASDGPFNTQEVDQVAVEEISFEMSNEANTNHQKNEKSDEGVVLEISNDDVPLKTSDDTGDLETHEPPKTSEPSDKIIEETTAYKSETYY